MTTREDAALVMQIVQWGAQSGWEEAHARVWADDFDPQVAKAVDLHVQKMLNFGELVGTFVKQGVLDRDLVYELWAMDMLWKRVGPAAIRWREHTDEPRMYENFEALARSAAPAGAG